MALQGTFDLLDFSEVLRLLARQQLTGRLHVRSRSYGANIFFDQGALTGADQSEHQAAASSGDVRGRLEEICFEMLDAERGGFEFQPGRPTTLPAASRLHVDTVLARARTRLQEWQSLQELIPSLDLQPQLIDDLAAAEVTLDQERWRMLTAIDGRRSLRAIGRTLNLSDFDVCRVMRALIEGGVVQLDPRAAAVATSMREAVNITTPGPTVDGRTLMEVVDGNPGEASATVAPAPPAGDVAPATTEPGAGATGHGPSNGGAPPAPDTDYIDAFTVLPPVTAPAGATAPATVDAPLLAEVTGAAATSTGNGTTTPLPTAEGTSPAGHPGAEDAPGAEDTGRRRRVVRIRTRVNRPGAT